LILAGSAADPRNRHFPDERVKADRLGGAGPQATTIAALRSDGGAGRFGALARRQANFPRREIAGAPRLSRLVRVEPLC
jgi:hypothetical protein